MTDRRKSAPSIEQRYERLALVFVGRPGVTRDGRGFGSGSLKVEGRMFASLSKRGEFIVKLPRSRVDALVASGHGVRFDPGHGRLMKEWLAVWPGSSLDWERLADEALKFTSSGERRSSAPTSLLFSRTPSPRRRRPLAGPRHPRGSTVEPLRG